MATRCQGVFCPRVSSLLPLLELAERWLAKSRCRHTGKKKENLAWREEMRVFLMLKIKLKNGCHDCSKWFCGYHRRFPVAQDASKARRRPALSVDGNIKSVAYVYPSEIH